jgi:hypothetical protein
VENATTGGGTHHPPAVVMQGAMATGSRGSAVWLLALRRPHHHVELHALVCHKLLDLCRGPRLLRPKLRKDRKGCVWRVPRRKASSGVGLACRTWCCATHTVPISVCLHSPSVAAASSMHMAGQ